MADPLSISASILAILTAAGVVIKVLSEVKDAPQSVQDVCSEVRHIELVFKALQRFLDGSKIRSHRAALIQLDDVVVILTQTVLVFSELEILVQPLSASRTKQDSMTLLGKLSTWRRVTWVWQQPAATRLVNQLQRHKASLTLILQIIQW
jgi:hypothetical protein